MAALYQQCPLVTLQGVDKGVQTNQQTPSPSEPAPYLIRGVRVKSTDTYPSQFLAIEDVILKVGSASFAGIPEENRQTGLISRIGIAPVQSARVN